MDIDNKKHKCFTKEEVEKFMKDKKEIDDWIRKGTILYGAWDMINVDDDIMLDHLYEVLRFFGVKNLRAPTGELDVGEGKKYKDLADKVSQQFGIHNDKGSNSKF